MKIIDRNPDVNIDTEVIPDGYYLHEGKNLMQSARFAGVPFGVARTRMPCGKSTRMETVGIIVRDSDRELFHSAINKKLTKKY